MPDRIVRTGILSSDAVNALTWAGEVFYRRLMSVVDDFGRYDGRAAILRSQLYPLKIDRVSEPDIGKWIRECEEAGLVRMYTINGKPFVEIQKFGQRIRSSVSKWPDPPGGDGKPPTLAAIGGHLTADDNVVVDVDESVVGAVGAVTAVQISIALRKAGVSSQPADPRLMALAEQGVGLETVEAACAEAKKAKPDERISVPYVLAIIERWAREAASLKAKGAAAPGKQAANLPDNRFKGAK